MYGDVHHIDEIGFEKVGWSTLYLAIRGEYNFMDCRIIFLTFKKIDLKIFWLENAFDNVQSNAIKEVLAMGLYHVVLLRFVDALGEVIAEIRLDTGVELTFWFGKEQG